MIVRPDAPMVRGKPVGCRTAVVALFTRWLFIHPAVAISATRPIPRVAWEQDYCAKNQSRSACRDPPTAAGSTRDDHPVPVLRLIAPKRTTFAFFPIADAQCVRAWVRESGAMAEASGDVEAWPRASDLFGGLARRAARANGSWPVP